MKSSHTTCSEVVVANGAGEVHAPLPRLKRPHESQKDLRRLGCLARWERRDTGEHLARRRCVTSLAVGMPRQGAQATGANSRERRGERLPMKGGG